MERRPEEVAESGFSLDKLVRVLVVGSASDEVTALEKVIVESIAEVEVVSAAGVDDSDDRESLPVLLGSPISMNKTYLRMSRHEFQA